MTVDDPDQDKVSEWATGCRNYTRDVLQQLGHSADLMQTAPGAAAGIIENGLAQESAPQTPEERIRLQTLLMAFLAEFLISAHGAKWTWVDDQDSPVGGRWVVSGLAHPLKQGTAPVDVGGLVANALASAATISLITLINQAELAAGVRILRGARP